jgi:starch synthase
VRATGGLEDTVEAYRRQSGSGTGFKFKAYTSASLTRALRCALQVYAEPARWRTLQLAGMQLDHSWDASARKYVKVYEGALARRRSEDEAGAPRATTD